MNKNENSSEKAATAPEASHAEQREVSANQNRAWVVRYMDARNIGAIFSDKLQSWFYPSQVTDEIALQLISEKFELQNKGQSRGGTWGCGGTSKEVA